MRIARRPARAAWTAPTTFASPRSCGRRTSSITCRCWSWIIRRAPRCSWTSGSRRARRRRSTVQSDARRCTPVSRARDDDGPRRHRAGRAHATAGSSRRSRAARIRASREEHFVEFDVGRGPALTRGRCWWRTAGSTRPTAASTWRSAQGGACSRAGCALEAQIGRGRWRVVEPDLGFPAGKNKTMLVDLSGGARRARGCGCARTWRSTGTGSRVAERAVEPPRRRRGSQPSTRGAALSAGSRRRRSPRGESPETPIYDADRRTSRSGGATCGYYTRFGDVRELLERRGRSLRDHERRRRDAAAVSRAAAARRGWRRDFVLIGDGWEKDGDYNTGYSQTVLPLPSQQRAGLRRRPAPAGARGRPGVQRHPDDWRDVPHAIRDAAGFVRGLRPEQALGSRLAFRPSRPQTGD